MRSKQEIERQFNLTNTQHLIRAILVPVAVIPSAPNLSHFHSKIFLSLFQTSKLLQAWQSSSNHKFTNPALIFFIPSSLLLNDTHSTINRSHSHGQALSQPNKRIAVFGGLQSLSSACSESTRTHLDENDAGAWHQKIDTHPSSFPPAPPPTMPTSNLASVCSCSSNHLSPCGFSSIHAIATPHQFDIAATCIAVWTRVLPPPYSNSLFCSATQNIGTSEIQDYRQMQHKSEISKTLQQATLQANLQANLQENFQTHLAFENQNDKDNAILPTQLVNQASFRRKYNSNRYKESGSVAKSIVNGAIAYASKMDSSLQKMQAISYWDRNKEQLLKQIQDNEENDIQEDIENGAPKTQLKFSKSLHSSKGIEEKHMENEMAKGKMVLITPIIGVKAHLQSPKVDRMASLQEPMKSSMDKSSQPNRVKEHYNPVHDVDLHEQEIQTFDHFSALEKYSIPLTRISSPNRGPLALKPDN